MISSWPCDAPFQNGRVVSSGVGSLTRYKVRFAKQTWPGETLVTGVRVSWRREQDATIGLECTVTNQDGEVKLMGEAAATLARRAG